MPKTLRIVQYAMLVPLIGWVYLAIGIMHPLPGKIFKRLWLIDASLSIGLHALQLVLALPIGRCLGLSTLRIVTKTMLFGATWWKPLKQGIISS